MKIWRKRITDLMNQWMTRLFIEQPRLHLVCPVELDLIFIVNLQGNHILSSRSCIIIYWWLCRPAVPGIQRRTQVLHCSMMECSSSEKHFNGHCLKYSVRYSQGYHLPISVSILKRQIFNKSFKICNRIFKLIKYNNLLLMKGLYI